MSAMTGLTSSRRIVVGPPRLPEGRGTINSQRPAFATKWSVGQTDRARSARQAARSADIAQDRLRRVRRGCRQDHAYLMVTPPAKLQRPVPVPRHSRPLSGAGYHSRCVKELLRVIIQRVRTPGDLGENDGEVREQGKCGTICPGGR